MEKHYPTRLPAYLKERIANGPAEALARQYIPDAREMEEHPAEHNDPIGDEAHSPVPGIVHRYENRVLLKPLELCAVYCRFCFRRASVGQPGHGVLSPEKLEVALNYIRHTEKVREVILTGGDPLVLSPRRLGDIMGAVDSVPHVKTIRIHTRLPVADPGRVTQELLDILSAPARPVYLILHVNHPDELQGEAVKALTRLRKSGCILRSQSVLLKDVNDSADTLAALFQGLVELGIAPYYLHHPDLAPGTAHFRVRPEDGQALIEAVRPRVSGLAMPLYVLDIPGGYGKVPIQNGHLDRNDEGGYHVRDGRGRLHAYDPGLP